MREIFDTFMVAAFVLFMIWLGHGVIYQAREKERGKLNKKSKKDDNLDIISNKKEDKRD